MSFSRRLLGASSLVLAATLAAAAGCSSAADPGAAERAARAAGADLSAAVVGGAVELHNGSTRRIFYNVVDPHFLGDWAICTDTASEWCHSLAPGASARVARDQAFGGHANTHDIIVYWWDANVDAASDDPARSVKEIALRME